MSENLKIWDALKDTDPKTTKDVEGKGFTMTAINPCSVHHKLTGLFGPCGIGWGFELADEWYRSGHTDGENTHKVHVVRIGFWYVAPDSGGEKSALIPAFGQTDFCYQRSKWVDGKQIKFWVTDEEAPKKSLTDAINKAASLIGVSADIFSGGWDANKYVNKRQDPTPAGASQAKAEEAFQTAKEVFPGKEVPTREAKAKGPIAPGMIKDGGNPISKPQGKRLFAIVKTAGYELDHVMEWVETCLRL